MFEKLSNEEKTKVIDFMKIYRKYVNPDSNNEINTIVDYVFDTIIKVYFEYKDVVPFISVNDDNYEFYIIRPVNGKYTLLDYLINTIIQNLDSIELIDNQMSSNYNMLKKKISMNKKHTTSLHDSVFNQTSQQLDRDKFKELFYKNAIYHEIGHMLHYKIDNIVPQTVYVPQSYMSLSCFPPLKKRISENAKKTEIEKRKEIVKKSAKEKIKKRISRYYESLNNKYDVLNPNDIDNCALAVERPNHKLEQIMIPPFFYLNPVDEAFSECDAQVYSGMFENDIFKTETNNSMDCFYIPIDREHLIMTYSPDVYFVSASIGFALKECISKESYFRTMFLGKEDLFVEFLGEYGLSTSQFAFKLAGADKRKMEDIQSLLDDIIEFAKRNNKSLDWLNIYFPLVYKNNQWLYYTDAMELDLSKTKKLIPQKNTGDK